MKQSYTRKWGQKWADLKLWAGCAFLFLQSKLCGWRAGFSSGLNSRMSAVTIVQRWQESALWSALHFSSGGAGKGGCPLSQMESHGTKWWMSKSSRTEVLPFLQAEGLRGLYLLLGRLMFHQSTSPGCQEFSFPSVRVTSQNRAAQVALKFGWFLITILSLLCLPGALSQKCQGEHLSRPRGLSSDFKWC